MLCILFTNLVAIKTFLGTCPPLVASSYLSIEPPQCMVNPYDGMKCLYSCDAGYQLSGPGVRYFMVCKILR